MQTWLRLTTSDRSINLRHCCLSEGFLSSRRASGRVTSAEICGMQPPDDLVAFWRRFGGGDLFESETILLPTIRDTALLTTMKGDNVETVTALQRTARPNLQGAVFHTGCRTSTFLTGNVFLVFDESDKLICSFNDLDSWYAAVPRKEFAQRYGHGPISAGQFVNLAKSALRQVRSIQRVKSQFWLSPTRRFRSQPKAKAALSRV